MKKGTLLAAAAAMVLAIPAFADTTVSVSDVVARQRYPWNGLVDITFAVSGINGTTNGLNLAVAAVMLNTGCVRDISHFQIERGGIWSDSREVIANGEYRLLWDVKADLGMVRYTNMVVRVTLDAHKGVQLWESGPFWATTNIGAEEPWEYGYYFWWGDTIGYRREGGAWVASNGLAPNIQFYEDPSSKLTYKKSPATLQGEGWITSDGVLTPEHDAAHVHWADSWRMPTLQELSNLNSMCDWIWTTTNGVNGYIVRGREAYTSTSIFLPAAGYGNGASLENSGSKGYYWSSVPDFKKDYYDYTGYSYFRRSDYHITDYYYRRDFGFTVRPIQSFGKPQVLCHFADSAPFLLDTIEWTGFVALDFQGGSSETASVSATYGSPMPVITAPKKTDYMFGGYYTEPNGGGTQYYTATGASARNWDKTAATTLYAYWMETAPLPVFRFYSKNYKGHFFTIDEEEKNSLIAGNRNWNYECVAYRAFTEQVPGTVALHRFYSKAYRGHFFTIDEEEAETIRLTNKNWAYEGVAYYVYPSEVEGSVPVYRFWSKRYRHHFYTTNEEEKYNLRATNPNWSYEGVAFWAIPDNTGNQKAAKGMAIDGNVGNNKDGDENDENDANATNEASVDVGTPHSIGLVSSEIVGGVAPWMLATWPDCEPVATDGVTEVGGLVVEVSADAPDTVELDEPDGETFVDALPLLLALPDGAWRATLRGAQDDTVADEDAAGVFGFTLPANGLWHWLRVRDAVRDDADDYNAFSLWLRAK